VIDLSKTVIIDEFTQKHRVHSSAEAQRVLNACDAHLVMLRHGNSLSLIGIVKPEGKPRQFSYSNQTELDITAMNDLLERRVFGKEQNDKSHQRIKMKTSISQTAASTGLLQKASNTSVDNIQSNQKYTAKEYQKALG